MTPSSPDALPAGSVSAWRLAGRLAWYRPWLYVASFALWTAVWLYPVLTGLVTRAFFDALTDGSTAGLNPATLLALLVGIEAARIGTFFVAAVVWTGLWFILMALMRSNALDWIVRGPGAGALPDSSGEAVARFRDDVEEMVNFLDNWIDVGGAAVFAMVAVVIMARIDPIVTGVVLLPLAGIVVVTRLASERLKAYRRAARIATATVTGYIGELFGAVQAVKVASAEPGALRRFSQLNDRRREAIVKDRLWSELTYSFNNNTVNLGIGLTLVLTARSMRDGTFTVGDFTLFTAYMWQLASLPRMLGRLFARERQVSVSVERLSRLLRGARPDALVEPNPVYIDRDPPAVPAPRRDERDTLRTLEVRGLTCRHADGGRGVEDVSLRLAAGSFTVITGRIGSGKSTLLRAILGLVPHHGGEILWNGEPVDDPASFFVPPRCAYVPQVPRLFSETLRDNILMGLPADDATIAEALRLAVLDPDIAHMHDGLDTVVGPRGVRLSGGQVQRTAAARMFVRTPELAVLDDLSSALDVDTERLMWHRVFGRTAEATCLVVSHRRTVLSRADQVIVMRGGRVDAAGTLQELLGSCEELTRVWEGSSGTAE